MQACRTIYFLVFTQKSKVLRIENPHFNVEGLDFYAHSRGKAVIYTYILPLGENWQRCRLMRGTQSLKYIDEPTVFNG